MALQGEGMDRRSLSILSLPFGFNLHSVKLPVYLNARKLTARARQRLRPCAWCGAFATLSRTGLGRDGAFRGAAALPCPGSVFGFTSITAVFTEMTIAASAIIPQASRRPAVYN